MEVAEVIEQYLQELELPEPAQLQDLDAGAEEELFRRIGQQTVCQKLSQRWQAADQEKNCYCSQCQQKMKALGRRPKRVRTLCGPIPLQRQVFYCPRCRRTEVPLDHRLGLGVGEVTAGLRRLLCRTSLELAYQSSQRLLTDTLGFEPCSTREMERISRWHGTDLEKQQMVECPALSSATPKPSVIMNPYCIAIDGVMIPGLADPVEHRLQWHEVKVAVLFDPRGIQPSLYLAGREEVEKFGPRLERWTRSLGLWGEGFRAVLGDGAPWIWNLAQAYFLKVPQVLDLYHAAEHLHATAGILWESGVAHPWVDQRVTELKSGQLELFFKALDDLPADFPKDKADQHPQRLKQYFMDNRERLTYAWALNHHLPIGSGSVESAARHIVQLRLKQSGMRWSDPGAQDILNLRTLHRSGQFEQYWEDFAASGF
jgi:hypothetical protein